MRITIRLSNDLDLKLQQISELIGVTKVSICMFALAKYLRLVPNISTLPIEDDFTVRYALSISDSSNALLTEKAKLLSTNKNQLVNVLTRYYVDNDLNFLLDEL